MPPLRIAFLGDIVGRPGRLVVEQQLPRLRREHAPDVIIANAENARSGSGCTPAMFERLRELGVDAVTLGDHVFRDGRILPVLQDTTKPIARPANLAARSPGQTHTLLPTNDRRSRPILIITVLGRIFFTMPADDPFAAVDRIIETCGVTDPIVIVEAHMEATSEKIALAYHLRDRAAAVLGTHTHVPTADARLLPGGTAFMTDLGMCGPYDSVIGREVSTVLKHMTTGLHAPFAVAEGDVRMCGAVVSVSTDTGMALEITPFQYRADDRTPPFSLH